MQKNPEIVLNICYTNTKAGSLKRNLNLFYTCQNLAYLIKKTTWKKKNNLKKKKKKKKKTKTKKLKRIFKRFHLIKNLDFLY